MPIIGIYGVCESAWRAVQICTEAFSSRQEGEMKLPRFPFHLLYFLFHGFPSSCFCMFFTGGECCGCSSVSKSILNYSRAPERAACVRERECAWGCICSPRAYLCVARVVYVHVPGSPYNVDRDIICAVLALDSSTSDLKLNHEYEVTVRTVSFKSVPSENNQHLEIYIL